MQTAMSPEPSAPAAIQALVVDDDEFVREVVARQLRELGMGDVAVAGDGREARNLIRAKRSFDLIVCDLMMPEVDGVELMRAIAGTSPQPALVLISSADDSVLRSVAVLSRQRGLRVLGALRKPVRPDALGALVALLQPESHHHATSVAKTPDADALLNAMARADIPLLAHPAVSPRDKTLHSVELRASWPADAETHFTHTQLLAGATRTGVARQLGEYLISRAVHHAADWWRQDVHVPTHVRLPAQYLQQLEFPDYLDRQLKQAGVMPEVFSIGIPEHALSDDWTLLDVMSRLRMRGIRISIDEFSSRRSPFIRLQRVPASEVRLDASLLDLQGLGERLLEHALHTATSLHLPVVADGVGREQHQQFLEAQGCTTMQGPLVAPEMAPGEIPTWQQQWPKNPAEKTNTEPSNVHA